MKKRFLILLALVSTCIFLAGNAFAVSYTFNDNTINWPGFDISPNDEIGTPHVGAMTVVVDDDGYLSSVSIEVENRRIFDSLFINTQWSGYNEDGSYADDWQDWDYMVRDAEPADAGFDGAQSDIATGLYALADYEYTYAPQGRTGHANGVTADSVGDAISDMAGLISYDGALLVYDLSSFEILVGGNFLIGYAPWCANDMQLGGAVPEPATFALLGLGLIGLAGITRRKTA